MLFSVGCPCVGGEKEFRPDYRAGVIATRARRPRHDGAGTQLSTPGLLGGFAFLPKPFLLGVVTANAFMLRLRGSSMLVTRLAWLLHMSHIVRREPNPASLPDAVRLRIFAATSGSRNAISAGHTLQATIIAVGDFSVGLRFAARRKSLAGLAARCPCCIAPTTCSKRSRRVNHVIRACASHGRYTPNSGHSLALQYLSLRANKRH